MDGIYEVTRFTRNSATLPPLLTSSAQWRRVFFSRPRSMSIGLMNDSLRVFEANLDTVAHRIVLNASPRTAARRDTISYEPRRGDTLRMFGVLGTDTVDVTLRRVDHRKAFRLLGGR